MDKSGTTQEGFRLFNAYIPFDSDHINLAMVVYVGVALLHLLRQVDMFKVRKEDLNNYIKGETMKKQVRFGKRDMQKIMRASIGGYLKDMNNCDVLRKPIVKILKAQGEWTKFKRMWVELLETT